VERVDPEKFLRKFPSDGNFGEVNVDYKNWGTQNPHKPKTKNHHLTRGKSMQTLKNQNPFADFDNLFRNIERNFESVWRGTTPGLGGIAMDIYERPDALYVRAAVPGANQEDIDVSIEKNVLTIKGYIHCDYEREDTKVYLLETLYGHFTRSVRLPETCQPEAVEAGYDCGVLTIRIPKVEKQSSVRVVPIQREIGQGIGNSPSFDPEVASTAARDNKPKESLAAIA
jgi:HSP20 family protein